MNFENKRNVIRKFINKKRSSEHIKVLEITESVFCLMLGECPIFFIVKDDVIKIAGRGTIDDQVSISVNGNKYETKVDTTGNWFVLFSINDAQYGEYPVNVYTNDSDKYKEFAKLKINVPTDIEQVEEQNILTNKRFGSLEIMLLSILGLVVVGVPIIILILKKKNEKKKK